MGDSVGLIDEEFTTSCLTLPLFLFLLPISGVFLHIVLSSPSPTQLSLSSIGILYIAASRNAPPICLYFNTLGFKDENFVSL